MPSVSGGCVIFPKLLSFLSQFRKKSNPLSVRASTGTRRAATRPRYANFIFFVDSSKTRSFKLPVGACYAIGCGFALISLWVVSSIFLLLSLVENRDQLTQKLVVATNAIFEYETRYEGVFEAAYSKQDNNTNVKEKPLSATTSKRETADLRTPEKANQQLEKIVAAPKPQEAQEASEQPEEKIVYQVAKELPAQPKPEGIISVDQVVVGPTTVETLPGFIKIRVDVRKDNPNGKAEGYIWAIVKIEKAGGKTSFIGSPSSVGVDLNGEVTQPQQGKSYSIRKFKTERFTISVPTHLDGNITEVKIGLMDLAKKTKQVAVPVAAKSLIKYAVKEPEVKKTALPSTEMSPSTKAPAASNAAKPATDANTKSSQSETTSPAETAPPANNMNKPLEGTTPINEPSSEQAPPQKAG